MASLLLAGCARPEPSESSTSTESAGQEVGAHWLPHAYLGSILAEDSGRTLYVFTRDPPGGVLCRVGCPPEWEPVLAMRAMPVADLAARLHVVQRGNGSAQLAIDGRPLYRYAGDHEAGDANGQAREGTWFVVRETDLPGQLNVDFLDGPGDHAVSATDVEYAPGRRGLLARPVENASFPGVVMIHEWWGLNENIRAMARALASHGYVVLAVDLFSGSVATTPDEARAQVGSLDQATAITQMRAAVEHLRIQGNAMRVASLGWCFGGGQSLQLALSGERLDATVIYYGGLVTDPERLDVVDWPVLGVFGADDASIPLEDVRAFEHALQNVSAPPEIYVYEGAQHAFANPSGQAYAPWQAMDAWAKTLAFLDEALHEETPAA